MYLSLMRNIRNAFLTNLCHRWTGFFCCGIRCFFAEFGDLGYQQNKYDLKEHFITDNAYTSLN